MDIKDSRICHIYGKMIGNNLYYTALKLFLFSSNFKHELCSFENISKCSFGKNKRIRSLKFTSKLAFSFLTEFNALMMNEWVGYSVMITNLSGRGSNLIFVLKLDPGFKTMRYSKGLKNAVQMF